MTMIAQKKQPQTHKLIRVHTHKKSGTRECAPAFSRVVQRRLLSCVSFGSDRVVALRYFRKIVSEIIPVSEDIYIYIYFRRNDHDHATYRDVCFWKVIGKHLRRDRS